MVLSKLSYRLIQAFVLTITLVIVVFLLIIQSYQSSDDYEIPDVSAIATPLLTTPELENVKLNIVSINSYILTFEVLNETDYFIDVFANPVSLEYFLNNEWRIVRPVYNRAFTLAVPVLQPQLSLNGRLILSDYHPLYEGTLYRIRAEVAVSDEIGKQKSLVAEFTK